MNAPTLQPRTPATAMLVVLGGIAMLSGLLVVLAAQLTAPLIAENQREAIERALVKVIPGSVTYRRYKVEEGRLLPAGEADDDILYAGYDDRGRLLGIAARAAAQGYADMIYLLYGYDPGCECIRGIQVLKLAETPGLADKIMKDPDFLKNFEALDARLDAAGTALLNPIVTVKHGSKRNPWEIDAISGATISSRAVGKALNRSAQKLLPAIRPLLLQIHRLEEKG